MSWIDRTWHITSFMNAIAPSWSGTIWINLVWSFKTLRDPTVGFKFHKSGNGLSLRSFLMEPFNLYGLAQVNGVPLNLMVSLLIMAYYGIVSRYHHLFLDKPLLFLVITVITLFFTCRLCWSTWTRPLMFSFFSGLLVKASHGWNSTAWDNKTRLSLLSLCSMGISSSCDKPTIVGGFGLPIQDAHVVQAEHETQGSKWNNINDVLAHSVSATR